MSVPRALLAEALGTLLLLATVVGSGVMGERLADGNAALVLLANAAATAAMLLVLIEIRAPLSGAHFNPAVTLLLALRGEFPWPRVAPYVAVQVAAAIAGVSLAHAMFELPWWQPGTRERAGAAQWLSECVATAGLLLTIVLGARHRPRALALLVAAWIFAAYWFTASTSFANPAVTIARAMTRTFAGIRPEDVAAFALAQLAGVVLAWAAAALLLERVTSPDGQRRGGAGGAASR